MPNSVAMVAGGLVGLAATGGAAALGASFARRSRPYLPGSLAERADGRRDPLGVALRNGCAGLVVGVRLADSGQLRLAAADPCDDRDPARTLRRLVLDPLATRVSGHGGRVVHPGQREPFQLLIELAEGDPIQAFQALDPLLRSYRRMLSRLDGGRVAPAAVTAVLAGQRWPRYLVAAEPDRHAFVEGTFADLGSASSPAGLVPIVAGPLGRSLGWDIDPAAGGELPGEVRHLLRAVVRAAHADGRRIRFTEVPAAPRRAALGFAHELRAAGVDLVACHRLAAGTGPPRAVPAPARPAARLPVGGPQHP